MSERKRNPRPPYPPEVRERAVRMVFDHQGGYSSQWKASGIDRGQAVDQPRDAADLGPLRRDRCRTALTTDERTQLHEGLSEVLCNCVI
jgi:transposase